MNNNLKIPAFLTYKSEGERKNWYQLPYNIWYRSNPVRNLKELIRYMQSSDRKYLMKSQHDKMSIDQLVDSYINANACSYKNYDPVKQEDRVYKYRYGEYIRFYLGKNVDYQTRIKIVGEFIRQLCYGHRDLPYYATTDEKNGVVWVHLWICDREYSKPKPKVYRKTQYQTPDGKMCGKDEPGAKLLFSKGDIKYGKDGKPLMTQGWYQNKTRIFTQSYTKANHRMRDSMLAVLYTVFQRVKPMMKFKLKPLHYNRDLKLGLETIDDYGNKRSIPPEEREFIYVNRYDPDWKIFKYREIQSIQYFVKAVIHELMSDDIDNYKFHEPDMWNSVPVIDFKDPPTRYSRKLRDLFYEYDDIFKSWEFEDENYQKRSIMFGNNESVMHNLEMLRIRFKKQVNEIVSIYNPSMVH